MTDRREGDAPAEEAPNAALKRAGIAAAILLAPGGFILGGILIARALQKQRAEKAKQD